MIWLLSILAVLLVWLWWDGLGAREIAHARGKQLCKDAGLLFLDDSVYLKRLRFCLYKKQKLGIYRRFVFEFASDGEIRYRGYIDMFGHYIIATDMQPYRI